MVQPVASEAWRNLISGVLPIASTTSLLMVIFEEFAGSEEIWRDPRARSAKVEGFCSAAKL
jgi:hypothetical protein